MSGETLDWHKVAELDELAEARVKSASAGGRSLAIVHFDGQYAAMDNHCPHQGGPLGEGSIEKGVDGKCWLRCPWHGWDFDPLTGKPPGGHEDSGQETFPVEMREDGVYVGLPPAPERPRTVSDVMVETMVNWGVTSVFGMVGHSNLGFADAMRVQAETGKLNYYGIRHEGAAAFAASAYGKLTGIPAAAFTIAGPGATNLLTGMWDAKVDSAPALALTGQVQEQVIGVHAFQDIDLEAAFQAVAAYSQTVHPGSAHAQLMTGAIKTAILEQGVGHLVLPDNTQTLPATDAQKAQGPKGRMANRAVAPPEEDLKAAAEMIASARRPMIILGYGARDGVAAATGLAEALNAPVATTFKAKGLIADAHPLAAGVMGRSGTPIASWFMNEADLLIVLGASFSDHTGIEPSKPIIQIDRDPMMLAKRHPVTLPVMGDVGVAAMQLKGALESLQVAGTDQRGEIGERWAIWRQEKTTRVTEDNGRGLPAAALFAALTRLAPTDAIIAVDVGNNTYSFGRYFEPTGAQRILMSGYLGSIGFGFPAAMGAWAATQDRDAFRGRKVISVSGDGGFGQYAMEFTTAVKYGMNITHVLMNNSELGKISKEQRAGEFPVWQTGLVNPPFAGFARACGGMGHIVKTREDLERHLAEALAHDGPSLVEVITDPDLL
ncbi:thiamine pyrophosphate-binding protein [Henriciella mobilis]|uniref:thiamine pyrophosphate-dependent enzyme n=1 Tax=Henriciella mobilis TaxID=2305467 RepID=UPI000E6751F3|nr:thiamine pyrophosphate-dependent enzyme [Henriciella mobilis]RIJ16125.1 thiamine pyrophosphate-binding protein [Henriciella mobilis]RIJ22963.1 thiamine pyrophosphate-binding protein [Henriciella mobilis]